MIRFPTAFRRSASHEYLVITIEDRHVRAALLSWTERSGWWVHAEEKSALPSSAARMSSEQGELTRIRHVLDELLTRIMQRSARAPEQCICIYAGTWTHSFRTRVTEFPHHGHRYTIGELSKKAWYALERAMREHVSLPSVSENDTALLCDAAITGIRGNGYPLPTVPDTPLQRIDVDAYGAATSHAMVTQITRGIAQHIHPERISIHSFPHVAFQSVRALFDTWESFLLVYVSDAETRIMLAREGALRRIEQFSFGSADIVDALARELRSTPREVRARMEMARTGALHAAEADALRERIMRHCMKWAEQFTDAVTNMHPTRDVPRRLAFIVEAPLQRWIGEVFEGAGSSAYAHIAPHGFDAFSVMHDTMRPFMPSERGISLDPVLAAAALFVRLQTQTDAFSTSVNSLKGEHLLY